MILLTMRAWLWLIASAIALRAGIHGRRVAQRWLRTASPLRRDVARARTIAHATHRAARLIWPRPSCLCRALAAGRMLSREGLEARVTIGVAAAGEAGAFGAHAWLTHGAHVLAGDAPARDYTPLCAIDAAADPAFVTLS